MKETPQMKAQRFYTLLYWQLSGLIPRPGGIHIYSKGATYSKMRGEYNAAKEEWKLKISPGVPYSAFEFGYDSAGGRLTPRGTLEEHNFKIIDQCVRSVARATALPTGGKVVIK